MDLRTLRRTARMTQLELAQRTGINRMKLSFAENHYVELSVEEGVAVRTAIAEAADSHAARVRNALAATDSAEPIVSA